MAHHEIHRTASIAVGAILSSAFAAWVFIGAAQASPKNPIVLAEADRGKTLVIGRISRSARRHSRQVQVLADYLGEELRDHGIRDTRTLTAEDLTSMIGHFKKGEVDLISETTYGAVELVESAGALPLLHE